MNKPIEQALTSLIPSINGPLPPELLTFAASLLAQSKTKARNLRPEEEISRTYACSNIACERLKQHLDLPKIEPRPPVPRRMYNRVFKYLDKQLADDSLSRPPRSTQVVPTHPGSRNVPDQMNLSSSHPRSSRASNRQILGKVSGYRTCAEDQTERNDLPLWVLRTLGMLGDSFGIPSAVPHVHVGILSVLAFERQKGHQQESGQSVRCLRRSQGTSDEPVEPIQEAQLPALVVTLFLYTLIRFSSTSISAGEHEMRRDQAIAVVDGTEHAPKLTRGKMIDEVEYFIRQAHRGWLDLEWYKNIPEEPETHNEGSKMSVPDDGNELDVPQISTLREHLRNSPPLPSEGGDLRAGLGTMMQDKVDYLSNDRRIDYVQWRRSIMNRVREINTQN
ncbi:origin recognition complex, subunit 6 [Lineolata rhizophorae]|uniref:Origin recognition complex, subunit 6 n=1 Tax=Lineolata rhizophorae TaxID=578093 RepID=A0A6A6PAP3_9PEZI|nr:origin recognition complex, subunit 6 [Lineolata rhizophorae]